MATQKKTQPNDVISIDESVLGLKTLFDTFVDKSEEYQQKCIDAYTNKDYKKLISAVSNFILTSEIMKTLRLELTARVLVNYLEKEDHAIDYTVVKRKLDEFIKEMDAVKTVYLDNKSAFEDYHKNKA